MRSKLIIGSLVACGALAACQPSFCPDHSDDPDCLLAFKVQSDTYVRGKDGVISITVKPRIIGTFGITADLTQNYSHPLTVSMPIGAGDTYELGLPKEIERFHTLRLGALTVGLQRGSRKIPPQTIHLTQPLAYQPPTAFKSMTVKKSDRSLVDYIGIANQTIYGLASGLLLTSDVRQTKRYTYTANMLQEPVYMDYLDGVLTPDALLAAGSSNVFLSQVPTTMTQKVISCPARPTSVTGMDCSVLAFGLPAGTQAMVVTPDEKRIILADATGSLRWGTLPAAPMTAIMPVGMGTTVRLATTDLDRDMQPDLIAVWQNAGNPPTVKAFLWKTMPDGFVEDASLSSRLSTAVGTAPISALAAGDVDNDGFGDLVIGQGQKLTVLQSQLDAFVPAWSAMVDPAPAGSTTINAIAVGRLDTTSAPDKPLDIVTASNTGYNAMNENSMYLHVFRPQ